jgi:hypothetical protein
MVEILWLIFSINFSWISSERIEVMIVLKIYNLSLVSNNLYFYWQTFENFTWIVLHFEFAIPFDYYSVNEEFTTNTTILNEKSKRKYKILSTKFSRDLGYHPNINE